MLRKHQAWMLGISRDPACGTRVRNIIADVTPAGGKSSLPIILGHNLLTRGLIDKIAIVTPRNTLRLQAEQAAVAPWLKDEVGHRFEIKATENVKFDALDAGTAGYATNYQSIASDAAVHEHYFRNYRTLLVLDEAHHLDSGGAWHQKMQRLWDLSHVRLVMSGTFFRHDRKRIAFLDYEFNPAKNEYEPILGTTGSQFGISYDWRAAYADRATIPMYVEHLDGDATWREAGGDVSYVDRISDADNEDANKALFTALSNQEYAAQLLANCVAHYSNHKRTNPRSRLLVVASDISSAKRYLGVLRRLGITRADIATSEDSSAALAAIEKFKGTDEPPFVDALVTVGMAYEGLDNPAITHLALLTRIRSIPWIMQALARAIRTDKEAGPWERQSAYVFAPADPLMKECLSAYRDSDFERPIVYRPSTGGGGGGDGGGDSNFIPVDANAGDRSGFAFNTGEEIDPAEYDIIENAASEAGLAGIDGIDFWKLREFLVAAQINGSRGPSSFGNLHSNPPTITKRIDRKKRQINSWVAKWADGDGDRIRQGHSIILGFIKKPREDCLEPDLDMILATLPRLLPLRPW